MANPRVSDSTGPPKRLEAGIISKIRLENFMCHGSLEIEFGDLVNFITGQNGSGKSAILTALCVAFGCRARGTQRGNALKDFIKSGCSYALVQVDIKNRGEDAFKHELYGDIIIVERRILESSSPITLKNSQGRKIGTNRDDLREIVEHFNIDVENPCTIMSQDKSREFLHSGDAKDKFKFFFKATLLQQVDDLLKGIGKQLNDANGRVNDLEDSLSPVLKELDELQEKIKNMEYMDEISQQVQSLRKKLAWSWVYDADRKLDAQHKLIEKLKGRIPSCQTRIDQNHHKMEELNDQLAKKKNQISNMMERTSEVRRMKEDLKQSFSMALKEKLQLEGDKERINRQIEKMVQKVESFEQQIKDLLEQYAKNSQAEENEIEEKLGKIQVEVDEANINIQRLKEEEGAISQQIVVVEHEIQQISNQIQDVERSHHEMSTRIRELQMHQKNKVTAFGGGRVTHLLQAIERHQHEFSIPPIGPIGAHVKLEHGDMWGMAIENAVGRLLNAFIVTDHKDARILRVCAREAHYNQVQVVMYDFRRPRLDIPSHMLPQTNHPTAFSVLHSDNPTVLNVLVDMGNAERQVLVKDYDVGRTVAFDRRVQHVKEVFTADGYKMFCRGSAETILPPHKNARAGRLSGSFDNEIKYLESETLEAKMKAQNSRGLKRAKEDELRGLKSNLDNVKRRRINMERKLRSKEFELHDVKKLLSPEANAAPASTVDDLHQEIHKLNDEIREKEGLLENLQIRVNGAETKAKDLKMSFENICESAKSDMDALAVAENDLMEIESDLDQAEKDKNHYETIMHTKVLADLKNAEAAYGELEHSCQESRRKASIICPESEIETLGCNDESPEQLSSHLSRLTNRLQRESQRFPESIADLRMLCEKKERKISRKLRTYKAFREKLEACDNALNMRWSKFQRNATDLKRQLTWKFNGHLKRKGISGQIKVSFEEQALSVEVKMPQDASTSTIVHDTKGLSGGERSFSTLCFALALHEMTEAPFRAMDEFDVFMDAVSRKISLDAIVDFALAQGSQWIFITPHDISMVKNDERVKKQQMAAPRG